MTTDPKSPRLALLICGSLPDILREDPEYDGYARVFSRFFERALPTKAKFQLDPYDVVEKREYPPLDSYDAIVLTGSAASAHEDVPWINDLVGYIANIVQEKPQIKIIGICFGHQIIARALGGDCVRKNWEVGPTILRLTNLGKQLLGVHTLTIQQMHRDHVPAQSLPAAFQLLGTSSICDNQGMIRFSPNTTAEDQTLENVQIFAVQGHPEFDERIVSELVNIRRANGIIDQKTAEDADKRKNDETHGLVLGKAIWRVLGVEA